MALRQLHRFALIAVILSAVPLIPLAAMHAVKVQRAGEAADEAEQLALMQRRLIEEQTTFSRPVRIRIPAIGVDVKIEHVGLNQDGSLGAPAGPKTAGWFFAGPIPGKAGSAIIAGHSGWSRGVKAAFDELYRLRPGERIYLEDQKGITITFVVKSSGRYGEKSSTSEVFNSSDGLPHLNLITCGGTWNAESKSYSDRVVVFSDFYPEQAASVVQI